MHYVVYYIYYVLRINSYTYMESISYLILHNMVEIIKQTEMSLIKTEKDIIERYHTIKQQKAIQTSKQTNKQTNKQTDSKQTCNNQNDTLILIKHSQNFFVFFFEREKIGGGVNFFFVSNIHFFLLPSFLDPSSPSV